MNTPAEKLQRLRKELSAQKVDAFLLPVTDEYQGEYSAEYARRVTWLTGFDGSAGMAVVLADKAALFVDGRYTIQAAQEIDPGLYETYNSGSTRPEDYLIQQLSAKKSAVVGYDPWLHTHAAIERLGKALKTAEISLKSLGVNPIDAILSKPVPRPMEPVIAHPLEYAGKPHREKRVEIAHILTEKNAAALLITEPDVICWLLNIRGGDIPFNPLPLCMAILYADGRADLFIEPEKVSAEVAAHLTHDVSIKAPSLLREALLQFSAGQKLMLDPAVSPAWFTQQLSADSVLFNTNPAHIRRAVKNQTEIDGMREAHRIDGRAVKKFIDWFHAQPQAATISELDVVAQLEDFRRESNLYRGPSFATISGAGPNGAIVHYRANEKTNRVLASNDILLLDSGGQYPFGTTDITRTLVRGTPSKEFCENYTRVLRGHIALATAIFPKGTSGGQLDILARQYLWQAGLDFDHGTGHGVGAYLCVHEGPQRIGKRGGDVPLEPGMILSNEPGYYKEGAYGIRIENLVLVVEKMPGFYGFETLTKAPLEEKAMVMDMLTADEIAWVKAYQSSSGSE